MLLRAPESPGYKTALLVSPVLYLLIAHGVPSFRPFSRLATVFLVCTLTVSAVCVYQGLQRLQCVAFPRDSATPAEAEPPMAALATVLLTATMNWLIPTSRIRANTSAPEGFTVVMGVCAMQGC